MEVMMRIRFLVCAVLPLFSLEAKELPILVGTFPQDGSRGVYAADFNDETGEITRVRVAAETKDAGFLVEHPTMPVIYACGGKGIAAFALGKDCALQALAAIANYGDGSVSTFLLDQDGKPAFSAVVRHSGKSVHPERQTGPHAHGVYFSGDTLFVPDLGLDKIMAYAVDHATGAISPAAPPFTATAPGAGPRHLSFHPSRPWVYGVNELNNTVTFYLHDGAKLTPRQSVSTIPAGFDKFTKAAEVEVHPNGNFVYASNRGHESIAVFRVDPASGELTSLGQTPVVVDTPRHFVIAPGGKFLLAAGEKSGTIHVFALDPASGKLTSTGYSARVPTAVCILFPR
jgi:6-phosphogluconolactonase